MAALSSKLALELASRLGTAVPLNFNVRADGDHIGVYEGDRLLGGSSAASIAEQKDNRTVNEKIAVASRAVLDAVQDCIVERLHEPWPLMLDGSLAMAGSASEGARVDLWYGSTGGEIRALQLAPLDVSLLTRATAI